MKRNRLIAWIMIGALTAGMTGCGAGKDAGGNATAPLPAQDWEKGGQSSLHMDYAEYLSAAGTEKETSAVIEVAAADFVSEEASGAYVSSYMGEEGCLYWDTVGGSVTWEFDVAEAGLYNLALTYCGIAGENYDIVLDVLLDGELPYENAQNVSLRRLFLDETYFGMDDNAFAKDAKGAEIRSSLTEQYDWQTEWITDSKNEYPGPLQFYLSEGRHTVTLALKEESMALKALRFGHVDEAASYAEILQGWEAAGALDSSGYYAEYEAEKSYLKNDITLFATYDTANVHVTPANSNVVLYNTIGKNTWKEIGQEITWEFEVPADGFYYIAFKVKQSEKNNAYSVREVSIDGEVLCEEMEVQKFPYRSGWYVQELAAAGEPMKVYLTAGRHVLGMKADMDMELAEVLRGVEQVTKELQHWYREIIKVTGFNADADRITIDMNRDFNLEQNIPGLLEGLESCRERLEYYYGVMDSLDDISGSGASVLKEVAVMLESFVKRPKKIVKRIETLRGNISNLATWRIDMQAQPLAMDKFMVYSPDVDTPKVGGGAWKQFVYRFSMFLHSFTGDTNAISGSGDTADGRKLRVWISTADITTTGASSGRDQAILLKKLIDETFSAQTNIPVEVSLVSGSDTLVQAVLAGEGPDIALFTTVDTPVNLAMRGALLDLSQFDDFEEVVSQFTESAVTPFWYKDGCYAFPETQNFNVLFYRTDIYEELGLRPPETWDEFYEQIILLANENYMVGVPQNQNIFETFLYQQGMTFYNEDMSSSTFYSNEALLAFDGWTGLYTKYSLSLIFDFFNRFRSGEMALAIEPYNQVNYLYSAAPEMNGLWDIAVMPGTVREDGTINCVETSTSTGAIALADTEYPEEAYAFLKWWVSAETQSEFGVRLEQTLGVAARYATANLEAFESIPWNSTQAEVLRRQRENTVAVEQIPGSYYIARNLSFAFRGVVYSNQNLRETLYRYNIEINKELQRKQKEFNY